MPKLVLMFDGKVIREYEFDADITIGRSVDNAIVIDNLAVSGHHAIVETVGSDYVITDLESTNGTFVNDKQITSHTLVEGDDITIGKHNIRFAHPQQMTEHKPIEAARGATMVLDTNRYKELLAKQEGQADAAPNPAPAREPSLATATVPRWLTLVVLGALVVGILALA